MNLLEVSERTEVTVKKIYAEKALLLRLNEMGIIAESNIFVLRNKDGPVVISVFGSLLALGRGQAAKIEVVL